MYKFKMSIKSSERHEYDRAKFISINKAEQVARLVLKDKGVAEVSITDTSGNKVLVFINQN